MKRIENTRVAGLDVEIVRSRSEVCMLANFAINGCKASVWDFGSSRDMAKELAEECGCGDRTFVPCARVEPEILGKYNLTEEQFRKVQDLLADKLHIGFCRRCR